MTTSPYLSAPEEPTRLLAALRAALVALVVAAAVLAGDATPAVWAQIAVLAVVAVIASTKGYRVRLGKAGPAVEGLVAAAAAVAVSRTNPDIALSFLPYLLAPCFNAGLRGGVVWAAATAAISETTFITSFAISDGMTADEQLSAVVAWALIALFVGVLGAWIRSVQAKGPENDPAYVSAHRLLTELWLVARQLSAGLDPVTLAHTMLQRLADHVPYERAAVFVRSPGGFLVPLAVEGTDRVDWDTSTRGESLLGEAWTADGPVQEPRGFGGQSNLFRAAFPLRMGVRTFGVVALESRRLAENGTLKSAMKEAEESALRLETALLFADVRSIASTEERRRLAREIHDGIAQELTSIGYVVDDLIDRTHDRPTKNELHVLRREVTRLISELRLSIFDLRTDVSSGSGLGASLSDYVQQVGATASGPTIHLVLDESSRRLRLDTEVEVLRIAQEAITNARKHSQAKNLWVTCRVDPPDALLLVEDDGVGLGDARLDSFGLHVMRERAERIGAQLEVSARRGGPGTVVEVKLGNPDSISNSPALREVDA